MEEQNKIKKYIKEKPAICIIFLLTIAIVIGVIVWSSVSSAKEDAEADNSNETEVTPTPTPVPTPTPEIIEVEVPVEVTVEVEREITSEDIDSGLNNMGILVTQEYFFTQVVNFTKDMDTSLALWNKIVTLFNAQSSFIISYDGKVFAGIDCSLITVEKDNETKTVTVHMPKAEIISTDIDYNSLEVYDQKNNVFCPVSVEDYNDALINVEETATSKAIDIGLLINAEDNAKQIISNFITSLLGEEYSIIFSE